MMGYGYGGAWEGVGLLGFITWLAVTIDLALLGIWLWKQIAKK